VANDPFPFDLGPKPERGFLLTFVLLLTMGFYFLTAFSILVYLFGAAGPQVETPPGTNPRLLPYVAGLSLSCAIGAWGIWRWRRWGVYLFAAAAFVALVIDLSLPKPALGSFFQVAVLLLIILLIRKKWAHFE